MKKAHYSSKPTQFTEYRITVEGRLDKSWGDWFGGMMISFDDRVTVLTGPVADQAALRGLLNKIWDLNLRLVSIQTLESTFEKEDDDVHIAFGR